MVAPDGDEPGPEAEGAEGQQDDPLFGADEGGAERDAEEEPEGDADARRDEGARAVRGIGLTVEGEPMEEEVDGDPVERELAGDDEGENLHAIPILSEGGLDSAQGGS